MTKNAYSIADFCSSHGLSKSFFYKLQKDGRAPRTMRVGARTLISAESAAEWRQRMESAGIKAEQQQNILAAG